MCHSCFHPFFNHISSFIITGVSAPKSLVPCLDFSMCQNASLDPHSCSPGLTSSRLLFISNLLCLLPHFHFHLLLFSCLLHSSPNWLFFQGDPALVDAFEGLNPQQEKHQFQIDILPVTSKQPTQISTFSVSKQSVLLLRKWGLGCEQPSGRRSTSSWRGFLNQWALTWWVAKNWIISLPWFGRQGPIYSNFWPIGGTYR